MKKILVIGFISLFLLQVSIKSLVSLYFQTIEVATAENNCMYKTITVCKGSCYVAKKIKVITSAPNHTEKNLPGFDINSFKDAVCINEQLIAFNCILDPIVRSPFFLGVNHYSFTSSPTLIKPPIA